MTRHSIVAAIGILLLTGTMFGQTIGNETGDCDSINNSKEKKRMTDKEREVLEVVRGWNDAFASNDPATYFTYIHDDLTLFIPSSPYRIDGKQDDKDEFEWSLNKSRTKVHFFQELQPTVQVYQSRSVWS